MWTTQKSQKLEILLLFEPGVPSKTIIFVGQGRNWLVILSAERWRQSSFGGNKGEERKDLLGKPREKQVVIGSFSTFSDRGEI